MTSYVPACVSRPLAAAIVFGLLAVPAGAQVAQPPEETAAAVDQQAVAPAPATDVVALPAAAERLGPLADQPSIQAMPSFKSLFTELPNDFRRMFMPQNLAIAGLGGLGASVGHAWDKRVAATPWGREETFESGQVIGGTIAQGGAALLTYAVGRATGSPRVAQLGSELFRAQIITQSAVQAIKFGAGRKRPDGTSYSFPSGHSATAFATATVIQHEYGWKAGIPAFAMAGFVASSRVQMRRHYVSDVIAGAAVGIMAGRSVTVGSGRARFSVDPMPVPGGLGVSFTKVQKK
jgi:membrane-associated phospholipid phosphatase